MAADETKADSGETARSDAVQSAKAVDEFDPMGWQLPLICKDCDKPFEVPYRHFQAGVVFHCPHCHGSFVPKMTMYRAVREAFETFYTKRRHDREDFARTGSDEATFARKQESELAEFRQRLDEIARAMRPAGKMVRPKGIGAMFT